jgi:CTP:molybdopterin cytidylyltransferase MocA
MRLFVAFFLLSAGFVCYVVFGYPLLLAWLARRHRRAVRKQFEPKTVTVVLPVRNGEAWIAAKLESILALDYPPAQLRVLVVSDGSTDATEEIVREYAGRDSRIQLERIAASGKAAALNAALEQARGEIVFFTDVRQPLDQACLRNLVACFADPAVGVASGELVILDSESRERASVSLYWRYEKWIRKQLSAIDSVPGATGAVYAMRRSLTTPLPPETLCDDMYLPLAAFPGDPGGNGGGLRLSGLAGGGILAQGAHAGRGVPNHPVLAGAVGAWQPDVVALLVPQAEPAAAALCVAGDRRHDAGPAGALRGAGGGCAGGLLRAGGGRRRDAGKLEIEGGHGAAPHLRSPDAGSTVRGGGVFPAGTLVLEREAAGSRNQAGVPEPPLKALNRLRTTADSELNRYAVFVLDQASMEGRS